MDASATMSGFSSCERDQMVCKAENIYDLALCRKYLLIPVINHQLGLSPLLTGSSFTDSFTRSSWRIQYYARYRAESWGLGRQWTTKTRPPPLRSVQTALSLDPHIYGLKIQRLQINNPNPQMKICFVTFLELLFLGKIPEINDQHKLAFVLYFSTLKERGDYWHCFIIRKRFEK